MPVPQPSEGLSFFRDSLEAPLAYLDFEGTTFGVLVLRALKYLWFAESAAQKDVDEAMVEASVTERGGINRISPLLCLGLAILCGRRQE